MNKRATPPTTISSTAKEIGDYPLSELMETKANLLKQGKPLFDLGAGDDSLPIYPEIINALKENLPPTSQYPLVRGTPALRESVANYLFRRFSVRLADDQIIPVSGSKEGLYHLPSLVIDLNSHRRYVLGPSLAYPPYVKGTLAAGGKYLPIQAGPEQGYLIELADMSEEILDQTAIVFINYPHNPTGASCTLEYLARQLKTAQKYGILLVSDECYADLYFGDPPPTILELSSTGVLAVHSLSKRSGMTGYRSGFIAGDRHFIDGYARLRNAIGTALSEPIALASVVAWSDDDHARLRREHFSLLRARFLEFLAEVKLEVLETDATFYLWVKAPAPHTGKSYAALLARYGILVAPGDFFGEGALEWFRLSLILDLEQCEQAFDVWRKAVTQ